MFRQTGIAKVLPDPMRATRTFRVGYMKPATMPPTWASSWSSQS